MNREKSGCFCQLLCTVLLLLLFSSEVKAQIFRINYINCKLSDNDLALLNRMGKFETNFYNQVFNTTKNDSLTVDINLYGRHGEYNKVQKSEMNTTFIDGFYSVLEKRIFFVQKRPVYGNAVSRNQP